MPNSKRLAGLVGPTIVAMLIAEFPLVKPHLYDAQIPPVVYLILLVGGLIMTYKAYRRSDEDLPTTSR
jgi:hypothetical protein